MGAFMALNMIDVMWKNTSSSGLGFKSYVWKLCVI